MASATTSRTNRMLLPRGIRMRILTAVALAGMLTSACDVHTISEPGTLASITVGPNATLGTNATQQISAVGYDAEGRVVAITPVWSVATGGGAINQSGLFTAGGVTGVFANTVVATVGGISGRSSITVTAGPLATITVTPNPVTLALGGTQQFVAVGKDAAGNVVPFTPTWSIVAAGGTIDQAGVFTAGGTAGTFTSTVQASSNSLKGFATVTVSPGPLTSITVTPNPATLLVGAKQQFIAVGKDAGGNVTPVAITWSIVAGGGTIDAAGLFTAGPTPGTYTGTVKATSGTASGTATVIVTVGPLATITVTPSSVTLLINGVQQFTATGADAAGNPVAITPTWAVVAGGGAIDLTSGVFTAGTTAGTYTNTVRASVGGLAGFASVVVTSGVVASITVSPNPATVGIGSTQQFIATGKDAGGNIIPISPTWSVVAGGGSIDPSTGLFTAGLTTGAYSNTVRAAVGAVAGTATVVVTGGALASITVSPNPASVPANGAQLFVAVGKDAGGNIVPITPVWSVVNGGGTINSATGAFAAGPVAATYSNTIKATSGAISGLATVVVTAPASLATITVTPNPASMATGGTQQFVAVGRDGNGNIFPIVPVWSVANGGGSINTVTGFFTAGGVAGTFNNTVTATSGATSGSATVIITAVVPPPLVALGNAAPNGIMAGTAFTCVSLGTIFADISISPGSTVTGFPPCVITGVQHLADAFAAQAQIDLTTAYNQLAGLPCPPANAIVANLGGTVKPAGVYCSATGIGVTGILTLDGGGNPNATFVFQAGTGLTTAGSVVLINGAQAKNVYWQVGSSATIGTASQWQGNILALTSITLVDNANLTGRALARNGAVSLGTGNTITLP
ncbi:MAG: hypothetical protein JWM95_1279 [Gemmatimonadetes bacterium]|nr:hypothetical protein [Gemmatimonadota bacterium]